MANKKNKQKKNIGIGKGKNLENIASQITRYDEDDRQSQFPGAYLPGTKVLALSRDSQWIVADIYQVRQSITFEESMLEDLQDEDENFLQYDQISVLLHPSQIQRQYTKRDWFRQQIVNHLIKEQQQIKANFDLNAKNQVDEEQKYSEDQILNQINMQKIIWASNGNILKQNKDSQEEQKTSCIDQEKFELENQNKINKIMKCTRYEYYVHFLGEDKRLDRWIIEPLIKIDPLLINQQLVQLKKKKEEKEKIKKESKENDAEFYLENDEQNLPEEEIFKLISKPKLIQPYCKSVESIQLGQNWMESWYFTEVPKEYQSKCLYICDFCLTFSSNKIEFQRHSSKCEQRYPNGDEIYRDENISFFEIDGALQPIYCQNLCLISHAFLEHKNLEKSIESFLFYILFEVKNDGFHFVGYFSKSKTRDKFQNNLSCIMIIPFYQRFGYGKILIDMSYALSILENLPGGPERPLSDLGHKAYVKYWTQKVVKYLLNLSEDIENLTFKQISEETGIRESDVIYILKHQQIFRGDGTLNCDPKFLNKLLEQSGQQGRQIKIENIRWKPYDQTIVQVQASDSKIE